MVDLTAIAKDTVTGLTASRTAAFTVGASGIVPTGVPGNWNLVFDDEFNGTSLDKTRWAALTKNQNNVTNSPANVSVSNGSGALTLASSASGAMIDSNPDDGAGVNGYRFAIGDVVEARILFPGSGTSVDNWPAFWTSGPNWPHAGEIDIAEGLGDLTINYHYQGANGPAAHGYGSPAGNWAGAYHVYTCHRMATSFAVYWDGVLKVSAASSDNGLPHSVLLNVGSGAGPAVYGTDSRVLIDYVRAWSPG